jgi:hypothetical protein
VNYRDLEGVVSTTINHRKREQIAVLSKGYVTKYVTTHPLVFKDIPPAGVQANLL